MKESGKKSFHSCQRRYEIPSGDKKFKKRCKLPKSATGQPDQGEGPKKTVFLSCKKWFFFGARRSEPPFVGGGPEQERGTRRRGQAAGTWAAPTKRPSGKGSRDATGVFSV